MDEEKGRDRDSVMNFDLPDEKVHTAIYASTSGKHTLLHVLHIAFNMGKVTSAVLNAEPFEYTIRKA